MNIPPPTPNQARILWFSLTALALGVLVGIFGLLFWGLGWILNLLSGVLIPLAIAGILAYILDPVVDLFSRKMSRTVAIVLVFVLALIIAGGLVATVVPRLVAETRELVEKIPAYSVGMKEKVDRWMTRSPLVRNIDVPFIHSAPTNTVSTATSTNFPTVHENAKSARVTAAEDKTAELTQKILAWAAAAIPQIGSWLLNQMMRVASWLGVLIGLALVPVYLFYFLREKSGIVKNWKDYLPIRESNVKKEAVFVINSINDSLIVFFRGQVLVALCSGALLTIGFLGMGLNYAFLLGAIAGMLGIVPYLGVAVSIIPAVTLAAVQFGDWTHPLLVVGLFVLVNLLEGFVISPKIIGDRVGLHPLTIIIAVMVGTTLMGGVLGGLLAIPLTAALRALMFRYVWQKPVKR